METKLTTRNSGFSSGRATGKLDHIYFCSNSVQVESFVLQCRSVRKASKFLNKPSLKYGHAVSLALENSLMNA